MRHTVIAAASLYLGACLCGCGASQDSAPSASSPPAASLATSSGQAPNTSDSLPQARIGGQPPTRPAGHEPTHQSLAADATPEVVVAAFLEATRGGDKELAKQLLTKKALEETAKKGLLVHPPGTPSMKYQIGKIEFPANNPDGAYVHSVWTETFQGGEESFDVTWVLRREPSGWRIAGMAAQLDEGELPLFLNFEEPDDLRRRMDESQIAEDEHSPPQRQAHQPKTPASTSR